ncbi:MAG TPA: hypothetical protein ENJ56_01200, partial [Anaerolineae bacterium]|nr:hypothetical protein [Anaerolineae bacterium]
MTHRIYGIRHHGPGSARALLAAFADWQPDCILIEGPPEGEAVVHWLADAAMQPPVTLLIYRPDQPQRSHMLPFTEFSPEYQAACYGLQRDLPVRFIDLPIANRLAVESQPYQPDSRMLNALAEIAGYPNYERWWNSFVEQRRNFDALFVGLLEMVSAAREALTESDKIKPFSPQEKLIHTATIEHDQKREACMRQGIRAAYRDGFARIAVVVGAWHGPALVELGGDSAETHDTNLLADQPRVHVEAAWIPWTYGRMVASGRYGAGIHSPGWYHHLWQSGNAGLTPMAASAAWLTRVARLLREEGVDASAAHVIETVRLAEALAVLRGVALPGLPELMEATQTVMCGGNVEPMKLIERKLSVGERMGRVADGVPLVPLQRDLRATQKQLDLHPYPESSTLTLDLRQEQDLQRSHLLHRLNLLKIPWGRVAAQRLRRP